MKKRIAMLLGMVMLISALAGCSSNESSSGDTQASETKGAETQAPGEETADTETAAKDEEFKEVTLTMLIDADSTMGGINKVLALAEEKLGIKVEVETRVGGSDGSNIVKTRLASGDMADLCFYNSGSNLSALNPKEYFIDLTDETLTDRLDETFISAVTVGGRVYGIPGGATQAGAILYSKPLYEKYNLSIPTNWEEFIHNCDVLKDAGETAVIGTYADKWTTQVMFLGDNYNIQAEDPDFARNFEAGTAKYATTPIALRSFEKLAQMNQYYNSDYLATTYNDGCDMIANAEGGHWVILTQALSNIYEIYGDQVNDIGVFGIPGDEEVGLTVWMPGAIYGNKNSGKTEDILRFMEFWISDEALDAYVSGELPNGPFCVKGYQMPDNTYDAVIQIQEYFNNGKTGLALEFLTAVKGPNCGSICQELGSGQTTALEAAQTYDADCLKQAVQLGLDWE